MSTRRVIILDGEPPVNEDRAATEVITPGQLLMRASTTTCSKNTASSADVALEFALERDEFGKDIDDTYAVGDYVKAAVCRPGNKVYAFIASGQNISANAYLEAGSAGNFVVYSAGKRLARALEAVNNAAGPGDARIRLEIV